MTPAVHTACTQRIRQTLRQGAASLDPEARRSVRDFVQSRFTDAGGFRGRSAASDVYYTVFGLECAAALELELPRQAVCGFLDRAAATVRDFVHLTCVIRCLELATATAAPGPEWAAPLRSRLAGYVCAEGGFHGQPGRAQGTVYDSFLGMLACESLGDPFPAPDAMGQRLEQLRQSAGGFANDRGLSAATTPVTAAALGLYWELKQPPPPQSIAWMRNRLSRRGGFAAAALVPLPDLLSTATALHALAAHGAVEPAAISPCLEFVTSLWDDSGGFYGHALDRRADCEYTFYALLALGNLTAGSNA